MNKISTSSEDYLEAIVMLGGGEDAHVRAVDIAEKLGVSKASVSKAVSILKTKGYVSQPYYGEITLTSEGEAYGRKVLKRHETLTLFLNKALGIDRKTAEQEACMMEHAISDESFEKWLVFIDSLDL